MSSYFFIIRKCDSPQAGPNNAIVTLLILPLFAVNRYQRRLELIAGNDITTSAK